jgi:hypothetical protein
MISGTVHHVESWPFVITALGAAGERFAGFDAQKQAGPRAGLAFIKLGTMALSLGAATSFRRL